MSLEGTLHASERRHASRRFYQIIDYFDATEDAPTCGTSYGRPRLIRLTYEYALSEQSRDLLLQAFFRALGLNLKDAADITFEDGQYQQMQSDVVGFAEHLMDNFFLPLKSGTNRTPQPSPTYDSVDLMVRGHHQEYATTPARLAALRGTVLVRDRHRCVISRAFDAEQAEKRLARDGDENAKDDDGNILSGPYMYLEVAHIIHHSLLRPREGSESRQATLDILKMLDLAVSRLIAGAQIDRPSNALTLGLQHHRSFASFMAFFTELTDQPHTYKMETFQRAQVTPGQFPVTRTLLLGRGHNIDPPSGRLLAVHRAVAHILHLSGAGAYIDRFLSDIDDGLVREDGSTQLDRFVKLRLRNGVNSNVHEN